jgi:hypothetical protein
VIERESRNLGWEDLLAGLAQLHRDNPSVLERNVLVGGAACFFYRDQLKQVNDADFRVPVYMPEEESFGSATMLILPRRTRKKYQE